MNANGQNMSSEYQQTTNDLYAILITDIWWVHPNKRTKLFSKTISKEVIIVSKCSKKAIDFHMSFFILWVTKKILYFT